MDSQKDIEINTRVLNKESPISIFLKRRRLYKHKVFFVVDELQNYVGTVTDGDLRDIYFSQVMLATNHF